jgi:RecB family exonuclease
MREGRCNSNHRQNKGLGRIIIAIMSLLLRLSRSFQLHPTTLRRLRSSRNFTFVVGLGSRESSRLCLGARYRRSASTLAAAVERVNEAEDEIAKENVPPPKPRASNPYSGPKVATIKAATKSAAPKTTSKAVSVSDAKPVDTNNDNFGAQVAEALLHPEHLIEPDEDGVRRIPYPKALSPSSIKEFQACPQSFLFQYVLGLRQPANHALAKGSMCHAALERVFDLDPPDRSLTVLQNLFRTAWAEHRLQDLYRPLFEDTEAEDCAQRDLAREAAWGREGLALLENYWKAENAATIQRPNPVQREVWVRAKLSLNAYLGVTATTPPHLNGGGEVVTAAVNGDENADNEQPSFLVRGIVDRLDMVQDAVDKSAVTLRLIDYKTGKAPDLKYSPAMNQKIQNEAFEQLLIYSLLLRESGSSKEIPMPLRYLRLFYLTSVEEEAVYWDMDLGATQQERDLLLHSVHQTLSKVWTDICNMIDQQNFKAFAGCDRSFCYCHKCRSRFVPGTVWEP